MKESINQYLFGTQDLEDLKSRGIKWAMKIPENDNNNNDSNNTLEDLKDYPALITLSRFTKFIAWLGVFSSVIVGIFYLSTVGSYISGSLLLFQIFIGVIFTLIYYVFWSAISEIIILFVDMAQDLKQIKQKK